jgi:hypothetical protein
VVGLVRQPFPAPFRVVPQLAAVLWQFTVLGILLAMLQTHKLAVGQQPLLLSQQAVQELVVVLRRGAVRQIRIQGRVVRVVRALLLLLALQFMDFLEM